MPIDADTLAPGLYVILSARTEADGTYHWMIYNYSGTVRTTFHVINKELGGQWRYEMKQWDVIASVNSTAGLRIGRFQDDKVLDALFTDIPRVTPPIDQPAEFTCRIWWREAIRILHNNKLINCPNVLALEAEAVQVANQHVHGVMYNRVKGAAYVSRNSA